MHVPQASFCLQVRVSRHQNILRITEAAVLAAVTIVIMILLSWTFGTCVEVPEWLENGYGITFHCPDGMPPVFLSQHNAITQVSWLWNHVPPLSWERLSRGMICSGLATCRELQ